MATVDRKPAAGSPSRPGRKRLSPGWVPRQHGAWAMVITPTLLGAILSGPTWRHFLLLVVWLVGYLALAAAGLWLRSGRRARYRRPVLVYGAVAVVLGTVLVVSAPRLLLWAPVFGAALGATLVFAARRSERSWVNDAVSVAGASLVAPVAASLGAHPDAGVAWAVAGVMFGYFFGTVLYVKTMIRERGRRSVLVASVAYHAVLALAAWFVHPALGAVATALAVRAWLVPTYRPGATPKAIGVGEIVATVALTVATWVTFG